MSPSPGNDCAEDQKWEDVVAAMKDLSGDPDLFKYPKSTKKDMARMAAEMPPGLTSTAPNSSKDNPLRADHALLKSWLVTMPDGNTADVILKKNGKELYIDASGLEEGKSFGSALYALVGTFAHNNGLVFIGDPHSISPSGKARRLEHLISLALKFGTTDFIRPHPDQNIPWKDGDHGYNLSQMIQRSHHRMDQTVPDLKGIRYDFGQRRFIDDRQRPFTGDDFDLLAQCPGARAAHAGATTLKRAVLIDSLGPRAGREGGGSVLAELARQRDSFRLDSELKRIYY